MMDEDVGLDIGRHRQDMPPRAAPRVAIAYLLGFRCVSLPVLP